MIESPEVAASLVSKVHFDPSDVSLPFTFYFLHLNALPLPTVSAVFPIQYSLVIWLTG